LGEADHTILIWTYRAFGLNKDISPSASSGAISDRSRLQINS